MSEKYEATGTVHSIDNTQHISDKFRKREFAIVIPDGKYPQTVLFQATGDRCEALDTLQIGDTVRVEFNLRGRQWRSPKGEDKVFNTLEAWRFEVKTKATAPAAGAAGETDDLPF